jgi:hypothetical protein
MKTFKQFSENQYAVSDRSLEGFRSLLDQLRIQTKGVMDPQTKQEIYQLLNPFYQQMSALLQTKKSGGVGYSRRHQYEPPAGVSGTAHNNF